MTYYTPSKPVNVMCAVVYFMKDNRPSNCVVVLTALLLLCPGFSAASEPQDLITISKVVDLVTERGFEQISEIELSDDGDKYEVKARDSQRRKVEIEVDARSDVIIEIDVED